MVAYKTTGTLQEYLGYLKDKIENFENTSKYIGQTRRPIIQSLT